MVAVPIPAHELKSSTWYFGLRCACDRLHALCEDLFAGKGSESHLDFYEPVEVACECGAVARSNRLHKFRMP